MNIFLLAVIIRQLAIICIALMIYSIYRLWNPNVTPLHLKPLTISISITILIIIIVSLSVKWFTSPIDYLPDDLILYILHSKAKLAFVEILIAFTTLCYGISLINFKSVLNVRVLSNLTSGVDFLLGILSQDPRFDVFYDKEQFGEHLLNQRYPNSIEDSLQPFLQINYEKMADYEFANNINVYFIYRNKKSQKEDIPELILVLKNEYHDYYDQLK